MPSSSVTGVAKNAKSGLIPGSEEPKDLSLYYQDYQIHVSSFILSFSNNSCFHLCRYLQFVKDDGINGLEFAFYTQMLIFAAAEREASLFSFI